MGALRSAKQSDSPSGATRDVYPLRHRADFEAVHEYGMRVKARARRLLVEQPDLSGEDPRALLSRVLAVGSEPLSFQACVDRAALAVLLVAAVDRAEQADPFTGGEAA